MMNNKPVVSVLLASYNQCNYLKKAIKSILLQDFKDFELIISDDASTDGSQKIIEELDDPRVKTHYFETNQGSVMNTRYLCSLAKAKYITFIGSDDIWLQGKLQKQVEYMEAHSDAAACFTWARTIDERDKILTKKDFSFADVFLQPNRSRGKWLRKFFYEGNCLAHPSAMIRKSAYESIDPHSNALMHTPDFDYWIRLIKKYDFHVIEEILTQNRMQLKTSGNLSAITDTSTIRNMNEAALTVGSFLDDVDDAIFIDGFHDLFENQSGSWTKEMLLCEKAFLLCKGNYIKLASQMEGFKRLKNLLDCEKTRRVLEKEYKFTEKDFYKLTGSEGLGAYVFSSQRS